MEGKVEECCCSSWTLSPRAKELLQETVLKGELKICTLTPEAFSFILDVLRHEHVYELERMSGFYFLRETLTVAFSKNHLYGLHVSDAKTTYELVQEMKTNSWIDVTTELDLEVRRFVDRFHRCLLDGYLPFFCNIDEDNLGSIEHLWTYRPFRKIGIGSFFIRNRMILVGEEEETRKKCTAQIEDFFRPNTTDWFWSHYCWVNLVTPAYFIQFETLREKARQSCITPEYYHTYVESILLTGILEKKVFGFAECKAKEKENLPAKVKVLDYFCVLDAQGKKQLEWTHGSLKSWKISDLVNAKRTQKYVKIVLEDAISFWEKRGFMYLEVA